MLVLIVNVTQPRINSDESLKGLSTLGRPVGMSVGNYINLIEMG